MIPKVSIIDVFHLSSHILQGENITKSCCKHLELEQAYLFIQKLSVSFCNLYS